MTEGSTNISRQIKLIAAANVENSRSTEVVLKKIQEVRAISRKNGAEAGDIKNLVGQRAAESPRAKGHNGKRKTGSITNRGAGS